MLNVFFHCSLNCCNTYKQNKRNRSQKMPSRRAQKTVIKERNLNPVLDLEMSV
ncbi:TPA: hypothetical protein JIS14_19260 [Acinetobacter baumannii]|nr:hypothetical protein ACINNAV57_A0101 [Acinetobacter baumannii Naval-57]HAV4603559.1 hypothetical protein [Acinetobacter baumannii]